MKIGIIGPSKVNYLEQVNWFPKGKKAKPIYIIKELISGELPKEVNKSLDLRYISYKTLRKELK